MRGRWIFATLLLLVAALNIVSAWRPGDAEQLLAWWWVWVPVAAVMIGWVVAVLWRTRNSGR
ncbi:MAG: hypothetical protein M3145_08555 [Pseudomonadota bacterium]|nr:hypothetical protein [Pseudomonadota bacterium]